MQHLSEVEVDGAQNHPTANEVNKKIKWLSEKGTPCFRGSVTLLMPQEPRLTFALASCFGISLGKLLCHARRNDGSDGMFSLDFQICYHRPALFSPNLISNACLWKFYFNHDLKQREPETCFHEKMICLFYDRLSYFLFY